MNMSLNLKINGNTNFKVAFDVYDEDNSLIPHNAVISNNYLYLNGLNTNIKVEVENLPLLEIKNGILFVDDEKTEHLVNYLPTVCMDRKTLYVGKNFSKIFKDFKNPNITIKSGNIYLDGTFTGKFLSKHGISDKFGDLNDSEGRYQNMVMHSKEYS